MQVSGSDREDEAQVENDGGLGRERTTRGNNDATTPGEENTGNEDETVDVVAVGVIADRPDGETAEQTSNEPDDETVEQNTDGPDDEMAEQSTHGSDEEMVKQNDDMLGDETVEQTPLDEDDSGGDAAGGADDGPME